MANDCNVLNSCVATHDFDGLNSSVATDDFNEPNSSDTSDDLLCKSFATVIQNLSELNSKFLISLV